MALRNVCDMGGAGGSGVVNLPNIRGWTPLVQKVDEEDARAELFIVFLTGGGTPREILRVPVVITDTSSTQLSRNASPTSLGDLVTSTPANLPGAFSAFAAAVSGASKAAREKAAADALISTNVIAANLRGPTS